MKEWWNLYQRVLKEDNSIYHIREYFVRLQKVPNYGSFMMPRHDHRKSHHHLMTVSKSSSSAE